MRTEPVGAAIGTARTTLVPLRVADAEEMAGVLAAAELYAFIGGAPPGVEELRARYARQVVGHSADRTEDWFNWIVRRRADGRAVGMVQATVLAGGGSADIAWVIGLPWQGQGYAAEAARALVDRLVACGCAEITAHLHPDHHASAAVAAAAGLGPTGRLDDDGEQVWRLGPVAPR